MGFPIPPWVFPCPWVFPYLMDIPIPMGFPIPHGETQDLPGVNTQKSMSRNPVWDPKRAASLSENINCSKQGYLPDSADWQSSKIRWVVMASESGGLQDDQADWINLPPHLYAKWLIRT